MAVRPLLIDEWQRVPPVFDAVRRLVDDDPRAGGQFLLTESASHAPVHSEAGRIVFLRMRPTTLFERRHPSGGTLPYAELLTSLRLLDPVDAWLPTGNHLRATNSASKHHLADPALAARLVRRSAVQLLHGEGPAAVVPRDGPFLGVLFESLAALSIRTFAVERGDGGILAIEAKLAGVRRRR